MNQAAPLQWTGPQLPGWSFPRRGRLDVGRLAAAIWVADHLHPDEVLWEAALFAHLASMVLGFGAVLAIDWVGLQWVLGCAGSRTSSAGPARCRRHTMADHDGRSVDQSNAFDVSS